MLGALRGLGDLEQQPATLLRGSLPQAEQARGAALQVVLIGVLIAAMLVLRPRGLLGEEVTVSRND